MYAFNILCIILLAFLGLAFLGWLIEATATMCKDIASDLTPAQVSEYHAQCLVQDAIRDAQNQAIARARVIRIVKQLLNRRGK